MIKVNAVGDACPIPVVKTLQVIKGLKADEVIETSVDNEIAVQNLTKMAKGKNFAVSSVKENDKLYRVSIQAKVEVQNTQVAQNTGNEIKSEATAEAAEEINCIPDARNNTVVVLSSSGMGEGNEELGAVLMKSFLYALGRQETLPKTILCYNGGAFLTCEDSKVLEDLQDLQAQGVEIFTCGTCLNFYGLSDKLKIGEVSNMYEIVEKMNAADHIIKP